MVRDRSRLASRFIPTCVGNMASETSNRALPSVHPHVCGEHFGIFIFFVARPVHPHVCGEHGWSLNSLQPANGSSPRVWGTLTSSRPVFSRKAVHPHVCGEHVCVGNGGVADYGSSPRVWGTFIVSASARLCRGSSPRVWGTSAFALRHRLRFRFIPTCVGNMQIRARQGSR